MVKSHIQYTQMFNKVISIKIVKEIIVEVGAIILLSATFAFTINAARKDSISLIRKPLKETRAFVNTKSLENQGNRLKQNDTIESAQKLNASNHQQQAVKVTKMQTVILKEMKNLPLQEKKMFHSSQHDKVTSNETKAIKTPQALFVSLKDAKSIYDKNKVVFIDARPKEDFNLSHITGAISLTYSEFQIIADRVLSNISKDKLLITYCSDAECESAMELGDLLVLKGYKKVFILIDGFPGWVKAGYPIESPNLDAKGNAL